MDAENIHDPTSAGIQPRLDAGRVPLDEFERLYQERRDPWRCESSPAEREKYRRTLHALGERRFRRALELGSGIGVFTAALANRCEAVVGLEPSNAALRRARERLAAEENVVLVQGAVPEALPDGAFDLVVCSEVLYYLSEPLLLDAIAAVERAMAPRGSLIAVHYTPSVSVRLIGMLGAARRLPRPPAPLTGSRVHELLRRHTRLRHAYAERHPRYLLDRFDDQG